MEATADTLIPLLSYLPDDTKNFYVFEQQRRTSFKEWPFGDTDSCSINKMAEAGFYWCGATQDPDSAACFMCDKHLDNWESSDDPWFEHKRHAPQCAFVKLGKAEANLTVDEFITVLHVALVNKMERSKSAKSTQVASLVKKMQEMLNDYKTQKG